MSKVRSVLQLCRTHTTPLEMVPAIVGAAMATGTILHPGVALWGLFGFLYHQAGYGMNSVLDWSKGYDKTDTNKSHHPLNTGELTPIGSSILVAIMLCILITLGAYLSKSEPIAMAVLIIGISSGVLYNYIGKSTKYKFIFISIAHTSVFIVPYMALGGDIFLIEFRLAALYVFLWVVFQISVSGEIKDIYSEEENFLRDHLGVTIHKEKYPDPSGLDKDYIVMSEQLRFYGTAVKGMSIICAAYIFLILTGEVIRYTPTNILWLAVWGVISLPIIAYTTLLIGDGRYHRDWRVNLMARIELLTLALFVASLSPIIGYEWAIFIFIGSVAWVVTFNWIEWGTKLRPDV